MSNILDQFLSPEKGTAPVEFDDAPIRTSNLDRFLNPTQTRQTEIIEPVFDEEYANSWGNRFAIGVDNTQASLFKGLDLIADITESEGLKNYAQEGIIKNQQEAASKPQPTRTASFTEASKEIKQELTEKFPSLDVRFACLHYNKPSNFEIDWYGSCIDKVNQDVWVVYPWEDWFDRDAVENTVVNDIIGRIK